MRGVLPWLALSAACLLAGCAHFPVNPPLDRYDPARPGYRFENLQTAGVANTDSVLVCVSFSGGGTRAAALAYGVVRQLWDTPIAGGGKRLLDEVDLISASSGGAFAAAYLGLFGPEAFLRDFRARVLERDLGMGIFWRGTLCPYNAVRLCSPWFNRSDLAAELYADTIFGDATYTHLQRRGRPFVVLNATDITLGTRFEFTQDQFDLLGSSLGLVPVARAVAASSAFPFLLTPVAFENYPTPTGFRLPRALEAALCEPGDDALSVSTLERTDYLRAREQTRLLRDKDRHRWVHLTDAGIADNLALGHVAESLRHGALRDVLASGKVARLVVIVVNARNAPQDELCTSATAPGVLEVLSRSLTTSIDRQSAEALRALRERPPGGGDGAPAVDLIEVDLGDLADGARRERLQAVETTFDLEPEVVEDVIEAGRDLLAASPAYQRLVAALR